MVKKKSKKAVVKNNTSEPGRFYLALFLGVILLGFVYFVGNRNTVEEGVSETSAQSTENQSSQPDSESTKIAMQYLNEYFTGAKSSSVVETSRIDAYEINKVSGTKTQSGLFVEVEYSVKPSVTETNWLVGNGYLSSDGWVRMKYGCVNIEEKDGLGGKIEALGTGCIRPQ